MDRQEEAAWAWCDYCRGEIYRGEDYYSIDGQTVCTGCLPRFAADYFGLSRTTGGTA